MPECKFVEDCEGFNCYPTQRACDCDCGALDPESPECTCPDADDCQPPKVLDEECNCECPDDPPCPPTTAIPTDGGCPEGQAQGDPTLGGIWEGTDPSFCYELNEFGNLEQRGPADPTCPDGFDLVDGVCVGPPAKVRNPETCECECPEPCPPPREEQEDCSCLCPPPKVFNEETNECICANSCVEFAAADVSCTTGQTGRPQLGGIWAGTSDLKCYTTDGFVVTEVGDANITCPEGFALTPEGGCKRDGGVPNPDTCECCDPCPPNSGKTPDSSDNCRCKCPDDLEPCPEGQFRAPSNCQCYCPPGFYFDGDECVECDESCDPPPPCYPIPLPPPGQAIFCPDGVTQRGVVFYNFNPASCLWSPDELIFRTCPGDPPSESDGSSFGPSSGSDDCDCDGAVGEAQQFEIDFVCGFPVVTRQGAGFSDPTAGCAASYTVYEWCDECAGGFPTLRSVQTFTFDNSSCEFREGPLVELACPESSAESSDSSFTSEGDNPLP